jgi:hypothetical protein
MRSLELRAEGAVVACARTYVMPATLYTSPLSEHGYGVYRSDGTAKPVLAVIKAATGNPERTSRGPARSARDVAGSRSYSERAATLPFRFPSAGRFAQTETQLGR